MAVEIRQMGADVSQIEEAVDGPKKVILRNMIFQRELVEQRRLSLLPWSHHRQPSNPMAELNQHCTFPSSASFSIDYPAQLTSTNRECGTMNAWPISGSRSAALEPVLNVGFGPSLIAARRPHRGQELLSAARGRRWRRCAGGPGYARPLHAAVSTTTRRLPAQPAEPVTLPSVP